MGDFRDRRAHGHSRHYVEHADRAKTTHAAPLRRLATSDGEKCRLVGFYQHTVILALTRPPCVIDINFPVGFPQAAFILHETVKLSASIIMFFTLVITFPDFLYQGSVDLSAITKIRPDRLETVFIDDFTDQDSTISGPGQAGRTE